MLDLKLLYNSMSPNNSMFLRKGRFQKDWLKSTDMRVGQFCNVKIFFYNMYQLMYASNITVMDWHLSSHDIKGNKRAAVLCVCGGCWLARLAAKAITV